MMRLRNFYEKHLREIRSIPEVAWYGSLLCLTHFWSAFFLWDLQDILQNSMGRICWIFWTDCRSDLALGRGTVQGMIFVYGILSALGVGLFALRKWLGGAFWILFSLVLIKFFLVFQDYRMMGNYHYMPAILCGLYLFFPRRLQVGALFLTMFYITAGVLKLNDHWLGGLVIWRPVGLRFDVFSALCTYVVILEMWIVLGAWSRRSWLRIAVLSQLILFHLVSYYWVGAFYPQIMLSLVWIFPLAWRQGHLWKTYPRWIFALAAFYVIFQLPPWFVPGDAAVHGQGRMSALNMYDARTTCWNYSLARFKDKTIEVDSSFDYWAPRIHCDPWIYLEEARRQCEILRKDPDFVGLDVILYGRRWTAEKFVQPLRLLNVCHPGGMESLIRREGAWHIE